MGTLVGIYISDAAAAAIRPVDSADFVPGQGIAGDRYFAGTGKYSPPVQNPSHEVTLVELEQVNEFNAASGTQLRAEELRRNLVTRVLPGLADRAGLRAGIIIGGTARVGDAVAVRPTNEKAR